ncbi:hypothetical protein PC128_g14872 [Phytophthora cactorum]|nr:hypothetical protein PC128_g14872 [Phytophthora cactorum]
MPWLARHDPVVNWKKRTLVRFGRNATESDGPVSVAHARQGASDHTVEAAPYVAASGAQAQVATNERVVECESNQNPVGSDLRRASTSIGRDDDGVSTPGVDPSDSEGSSVTDRVCDDSSSVPGTDTSNMPGTPATSSSYEVGVSAQGLTRPQLAQQSRKTPPQGVELACSRAAGLRDEVKCIQAGLDCARPRKESADGYEINGNPSKARPERGTSGAGLHKKKRRRKRHKLRKSRSGTETLQEMSAGQTSDATSSVETFNVSTRTRTGLQYRSMEMENPPTSASELTSLPVMSWMRFAKDLLDGRVEQICILSDLERMKSEADELRQLHAASTTESEDTLSAKTKKERFDGQSWDSLKASPFHDVLREHKDVLPDEIPAELPQDKGLQHDIGIMPCTKYCVTRQWPLPRDQVKAIVDFFECRRQAGQMRESKSPHSAPTFYVKKPKGG